MIEKEKIGQMLCFAFRGDSYDDQIKELVEEIKVGGIIYFARNIKDNHQVKKLNQLIQERAKTPLLIGLDQEGGMVQRITKDITPFPGAMSLSATCESNFEICKFVGEDLVNLGFNINFAPCADVNSNPRNPVINSRSYSDDPYLVSKYVNDAIDGFEKANILTTVKHFPGHGDTHVDSHLSLPIVNKSLEELEKMDLIPFKKAIENSCPGIMLSHVLYNGIDDTYPASLSKKIITDLLKGQYGFNGLIVTDSLTMGAINNNYNKKEIVELAVNAGVDLLIFCGKADINEQREIYQGFIELVEEGKISEQRINESVDKILSLKKKYCNKINDGKNCLDKTVVEAERLSQKSITLVQDNEKLLPINQKDTLILFPKIKLATLVDNDTNEYSSLNKFTGCKEIFFDDELTNLNEIINETKKYKKIVLCGYNVKADDYQVKLFSFLDRKKVILVSLRSPYDYLYLTGSGAHICTYEATTLAYRSLSKCLLGDKEFKGKLPIKYEE